jgi:ABC-2 type transport system permease protein
MHGFYAVFRKETANFFTSPIAYAVIGCFLLISGFFFWANISFLSLVSMQAASNPMLSQRINMTDVVLRPLAQNMGIVLLFVTPLVTMRLFSEEKRSGTIELLLTYPLGDLGVILGKYLAALFLLAVMLAGTLPAVWLMFKFGPPDLGPLLGGYLGLFLMGAAFISLGMFISSLTENQIVAAAVSFGAALLFWILSWTATFTGDATGAVIRQLSILEHLEALNKGLIALSDVTFFLLFIAFFLFMTARSVEASRWRG